MKRVREKWEEIKRDASCHLRAVKLLLTYNREWMVMGITILMDSIYPFISIYLSAMLLNALYAGESPARMMAWALAGAGAALLVTLVRHWVAKYKNMLWWGIHFRMAEPVMEKSMKMDYELTEDREVQALRARQEEYQKRKLGVFEIFIWQLESLLTAVLKLIFSLITVWTLLARLAGLRAGYAFWLSLAAAAALAAGMACVQRIIRREGEKHNAITRRTAEQNRLNDYIMSNVVLDTEAGKDIRLFHQQKMMEEYGEQMNESWRAAARQRARYSMKQTGVQSLFSACVGGVIYLYTGLCAYGGSILAGDVVKYAGGIQQMVQALTDILAGWAYLHKNRGMMEEYLAYLDLPEVKKKGTIPVQKRRDGRFLIEFRDVSFRYPGSEQDVLRHLNVKLNIGERVALVGRNGSGKTTFVKLLCRLYDPTEGVILLNGVDIRKYRYEEYMRLFSVVFQDFSVFSLAMDEYVAAGEHVEEARALDALERAGLSELLEKLPDGLHTVIGREFSDRGADISGGEAQKLAMARAIYKDAPFVILDEPTAALDPVAENEIYTGFHEIIGDKTALFISHRLSACRFAKEILVFEDGDIVQRGNHEDLKDVPGLYRRMWQAQAKYYQD